MVVRGRCMVHACMVVVKVDYDGRYGIGDRRDHPAVMKGGCSGEAGRAAAQKRTPPRRWKRRWKWRLAARRRGGHGSGGGGGGGVAHPALDLLLALLLAQLLLLRLLGGLDLLLLVLLSLLLRLELLPLLPRRGALVEAGATVGGRAGAVGPRERGPGLGPYRVALLLGRRLCGD